MKDNNPLEAIDDMIEERHQLAEKSGEGYIGLPLNTKEINGGSMCQTFFVSMR